MSARGGAGRGRLVPAVVLLTAALAAPAHAAAQGRPADLVITGGVSWESYQGNFSAVHVPTVDSTDHATAAVGEFGARGRISVLNGPGRSLQLSLDGGLRQFAAMGFHLRDYAPREWVTRATASYQQAIEDAGVLTLRGAYSGRAVEDRPPMPLFLQPGYGSFTGTAGFQLLPIQDAILDAQLHVERTDYRAPRLLPQLDLLDRKSEGVEVGAAAGGGDAWAVRFYTGLRRSHYEHQATSDAEDPFRRDRTVNLGASWALTTYVGANEDLVQASLGVEGTVNRSNSRRPEYDALSVTGNLYTALPWAGISANAVSLLTWKTYVHQTSFARLVPGEEADNASVVYLDLIRRIATNLDATLRFGWTRAETDIGNAYYRRFGVSALFNFRPAF
jgi:hypothetical protein